MDTPELANELPVLRRLVPVGKGPEFPGPGLRALRWPQLRSAQQWVDLRSGLELATDLGEHFPLRVYPDRAVGAEPAAVDG